MAELISRCPGCATSFKVSSVQLTVAQGQVRCGVCQHVFNGLEHITAKRVISDKGLVEQPIDSGDILIYDEMQLEKETVESTETMEPEFQEQKLAIPSPSEFIEAPVFSVGQPTKNARQTLLWSPLIILLVCALALQYVHFNALSILQNFPKVEPYVAKLCLVSGCQLYGYDQGKMAVVDLQVASLTGQNEALRISGSLVNHAAFPQRLPTLLVAFDSIEGTTVAERAFLANEYLQGKMPQNGLLSGKRRLQFQLDIVDPGKAAQSYSVDLY